MGGCCANEDAIAFLPNIGKTLDTRDIDQQLWLGESQLHCRNQTMSAGEHFRSVRVLRKYGNCLFECVCDLVVELSGNHFKLLCVILDLGRRSWVFVPRSVAEEVRLVIKDQRPKTKDQWP